MINWYKISMKLDKDIITLMLVVMVILDFLVILAWAAEGVSWTWVRFVLVTSTLTYMAWKLYTAREE